MRIFTRCITVGAAAGLLALGAASVVAAQRLLRSARQVILATLAFEIADDLRHGRLADIYNCNPQDDQA